MESPDPDGTSQVKLAGPVAKEVANVANLLAEARKKGAKCF